VGVSKERGANLIKLKNRQFMEYYGNIIMNIWESQIKMIKILWGGGYVLKFSPVIRMISYFSSVDYQDDNFCIL